MADEHVPVLAERIAGLLEPSLARGHSVYLDATLGLAGHSIVLLRRHPRLTVIGIDRDPEALSIATARITEAGFGNQFHAVHAVYDRIPDVLAELSVDRVDGVLFDLGVSSMQLDRVERGFAYSVDAPLDMRMDSTTGPTAADILNTWPPGEERFATRIVGEVVRQRGKRPWTTSGPLVELVRSAIPAATRRTGGHPAKRTFQALRIAVNDELGALQRAIPAAVAALSVGGRLVVLSYQSLEDRLVKQALMPLTVSSSPPDLPVELPEHAPQLRWVTRGAQAPDEAEVAANPRAASARLRVAERIREAA